MYKVKLEDSELMSPVQTISIGTHPDPQTDLTYVILFSFKERKVGQASTYIVYRLYMELTDMKQKKAIAARFAADLPSLFGINGLRFSFYLTKLVQEIQRLGKAKPYLLFEKMSGTRWLNVQKVNGLTMEHRP